MTASPLPGVSLLAAAPQLAALAALEVAAYLAADALCAMYPELNRPLHDHEPAELAAARILVEETDAVVAMIADYRAHLRRRLECDTWDWPF